MGKPKFYLRKANRYGECLIQMRYRFAGKELWYSTQRFVDPKDWNKVTQQAKGRRGRMINNRLRRLAAAAEDYFYSTLTPTPAGMRRHLDAITGRQETANRVFDYFDSFIEQRAKDPAYKASSVRVYRTARKKLMEFVRASSSPTFTFQDMDLAFFRNYAAWLRRKEYEDAYTHKLVTTVMAMLNQAVSDKATSYRGFRDVRIKADLKLSKRAAKGIYLTWEEIQRLRSHPMPTAALARIRDLFIILAYTGQRYGDLREMTRRHLTTLSNGVKAFRYKTEKTSTPVIVPIHPHIEPILEGCGWQLRQVSNGYFNRSLKKIGQAAKLDKWPKLTTHVGRSSFITNAQKMGYSAKQVMAIVGHKSTEVHAIYDRRDLEERVIEFTEGKFFDEEE